MNTSSAYLCKKLRPSILGHVFTIHKPPYPYQLPKGWEWTSVGDVCDTSLGKMLDRANNEGILKDYLRNVNVRWSSFDLTNVLKMPFKEIEMEQYQIHKGDLIICEGGEPGRCAIWENDYSIMYQKALHRVRCSKAIFNKYLAILLEYYANSNNLKPYFTGSTIKHLTRESLNSVKVPLPPFKEQRNITAKINQWLAIIGLIEEGKGNLQISIKQAKSKILDLAIHGKLVPQDPSDEPASELLKRINPKAEIICDNPRYGKLPKKWCICRLKDICVFLSRGKSPKYLDEDGTYPVFAQKCNLKDGGISLQQARFLDPATIEKWSEVYKLKTGDILVNSTGTGTVGRTRLFDDKCLGHYPFVVPDSHVSVIRTFEDISSEYIYTYMSSDTMQDYISDNLAGSTNQKELYIGILENILVSLPPLQEQHRIVAKIEEIFTLLDKIEASL